MLQINISKNFSFEKIGKNDKLYICVISFNGGNIPESPFVQNTDYSKDEQGNYIDVDPNALINFSTGEFTTIEVRRDSWQELETRATAIYDRLKVETQNGVNAIGTPPDNVSETYDGSNWV